MSSYNALADNIMNTRQNIISLTEQDYDATPIVIILKGDLKLRIDLDIYSKSMAGDTMIWDHPTQGIWDAKEWGDTTEVGFILGHPKYGILSVSGLGTTAATWVLEEELINV